MLIIIDVISTGTRKNTYKIFMILLQKEWRFFMNT